MSRGADRGESDKSAAVLDLLAFAVELALLRPVALKLWTVFEPWTLKLHRSRVLALERLSGLLSWQPNADLDVPPNVRYWG
jgi:hypothetical protein